uniref:Superoxide dismutase fe n=1 Tax=Rhizophora mucronata TaxID=61149 RepID=A0A2P2K482_RHIMU
MMKMGAFVLIHCFSAECFGAAHEQRHTGVSLGKASQGLCGQSEQANCGD